MLEKKLVYAYEGQIAGLETKLKDADTENDRLRSGIMDLYMPMHGEELKMTGRKLRALLDQALKESIDV